MNEINGFRFYKNYYRLIKLLPNNKQQKLYKAISEYMFEDKEPNFDENSDEYGVWISIVMGLGNTKTKIINGQKGGAPEGNNNAEKKQPNEQPKNNLKNNLTDKLKDKQKTVSSFMFIVSSIYISNLDNKDYIYKLFNEYLELRIKNKYTMTETVVKRLVNKLNDYGRTDEEKIEILENAINGGWKDFWRLSKKEPNWYGENVEEEKASDEEIKELERIIDEI